MSIVKKNTPQSYWDILPDEIQDLIIEIRDKNLYRERQELLQSLSLNEILTALDYKYCEMINQSQDCDHTQVITRISNSVYKIPARVFRISSYDITDVMDGLNLAINMERSDDGDQDPIVEYWDDVDEIQQGIDAAECFDEFCVTDLERTLSRDEDEFVHFAGYCLDTFRNIYNNRENNN